VDPRIANVIHGEVLIFCEDSIDCLRPCSLRLPLVWPGLFSLNHPSILQSLAWLQQIGYNSFNQ
jgi:hypothetical protein